jgi:hypothetical protein
MYTNNPKAIKNAQNVQNIVFTQPAKNNNINLLVHGQGVFVFDINTNKDCSFSFLTKDKTDGLKVSLSTTEFLVTRIKNNDKFVSQSKKSGITNKSGVYYWFSLDSQNQLMYAGIGEPRIETVCYTYQFDTSAKLSEANKMFLESIVSIVFTSSVLPLRLLKNPITSKIPLIVKGINELTMNDVASNAFLPSASLSVAGQSLYNCVAGEKFILDAPDFPDFSKAIEHSINTQGLWCNTRLKEKATEFGKNPQPLETYLRITLGQNNGDSPGIPYVMEIWPVGHYSPVHNHSEANAIIRVLHGDINVSLFPYLCDDINGVEPFANKDFKTNDITWISSTLNQVHQLKNLDTNTKTCITIQCYLYDNDDKTHYDYFDYLGDKNAKNQYEPDSDMDFLEFKKLMQNEWSEACLKTANKPSESGDIFASMFSKDRIFGFLHF